MNIYLYFKNNPEISGKNLEKAEKTYEYCVKIFLLLFLDLGVHFLYYPPRFIIKKEWLKYVNYQGNAHQLGIMFLIRYEELNDGFFQIFRKNESLILFQGDGLK